MLLSIKKNNEKSKGNYLLLDFFFLLLVLWFKTWLGSGLRTAQKTAILSLKGVFLLRETYQDETWLMRHYEIKICCTEDLKPCKKVRYFRLIKGWTNNGKYLVKKKKQSESCRFKF